MTWTIDIPDGSVVHAVYAVWGSQGNTPGADYSYSEGLASDTVTKNHTSVSDSATNGGLIISWTDDIAVVRNADFETLFSTPITVAGGDGFKITAVADGFGWSDAVLIDYTPVPEPGSLALLGLGGLCVLRRRRG